jgi:hypothetical protein
LREGLRYVAGWPGLMVLMGVSMLLNLLFNPAFSLLPLLVKNHFHGGALQSVWFEMAFGIGMISGSVLLGVWGDSKFASIPCCSGYWGWEWVLPCLLLPMNSIVYRDCCHGLFWLCTTNCQRTLVRDFAVDGAQRNAGSGFRVARQCFGVYVADWIAVGWPASDKFGLQIWFLAAGIASLSDGADIVVLTSDA